MSHTLTDPDLAELDRIWPLGRQLNIPDGGKVLVAGAYRGRYMDYVCSRYNPRLVVGYEPQPLEARDARKRLLKHIDKCECLIFSEGLGVHDCLVTMRNWGTDGCSIDLSDPKHLVKLTGINSVLFTHGAFDLFICNMENYEYCLLPYLVGSDQMEKIRSLAVQFHDDDNHGTRDLMDRHYGAPVYSDWPTWMYWRD